MKVPFVILVLLPIAMFHLAKYLLFLPALIRLSERFTDKFVMKIILQAFAIMRWTEVFHKDDADFDFVKAKTNKLFVDKSKHIKASEPTLLIANDTSVLQHIWIVNQFSPVFVTMDLDKDSGKAGLRPLGGYEAMRRACGINFP